ncbi:alpha/beta hydrolase family protein [Streptomyces sp. URMC 123]|uniref:alpha/beta hydrolase family protein n=1 Tax=Streptomyces sp. URMC 123 TaxID=3423403 RepID=UPI003F19BDC8
MTTLHRGALVTALALALTLPLAAGAAAAAPGSLPAASPSAAATATATASDARASSRLELPRPTGPHAVGRDVLHLVDKSRRDPWVPEAGARELMVSMYYPARAGSGRPTSYMTREAARELLTFAKLDQQISPEAMSGTRTHAREGARPARGTFPMVVLSPGFSAPRTTLTHLAEDLASRGHVVALVDHAYEAVGATFTGGRTLPCVACEALEGGTKGSVVVEGRAKDVSFVLDRLTGRHPAWRHAGLIDARRIGMAGHSIGGASAAGTMAADRRVLAGINMDGSFGLPVPAEGLNGRPFMMLGTETHHRPGAGFDPTWDRDWPRLDGWKRWLTVAGSGHFTFSDVPVLFEQSGVDDPDATLSARRSEQITRDYVAAFFDLHLRGVAQPLLEGPTPGNPEVRFHRP